MFVAASANAGPTADSFFGTISLSSNWFSAWEYDFSDTRMQVEISENADTETENADAKESAEDKYSCTSVRISGSKEDELKAKLFTHWLNLD